VPIVAASSIARRLSSIFAFRSAGSVEVKNPLRHSDDTLRPASATRRAALSTPYSWIGSRHRPIQDSSALALAATTSSSGQYLVVAWLRL
jgi:hypothetical protein